MSNWKATIFCIELRSSRLRFHFNQFHFDFIPLDAFVVSHFRAVTITTKTKNRSPLACVDVFQPEISIPRMPVCWRKCEKIKERSRYFFFSFLVDEVEHQRRKKKRPKRKDRCGSFFFHCTGVFFMNMKISFIFFLLAHIESRKNLLSQIHFSNSSFSGVTDYKCAI